MPFDPKSLTALSDKGVLSLLCVSMCNSSFATFQSQNLQVNSGCSLETSVNKIIQKAVRVCGFVNSNG